MSNDLISRSALMSHIENERRQWGEDYDAEQILGDIEDMPVAYDPDKVAEQLKKDSAVKLYGSNNSNNYLIPVKRAIDIVKGGGVDE